MGLFSKKADPIASKAKELEQQITQVQLQIKKLHRELENPRPQPARPEPPPKMNGHDHAIAPAPTPMRSTVSPHSPRSAQIRNVPREPIFESVEQAAPPASADPSKAQFNDLGVRKYDLP